VIIPKNWGSVVEGESDFRKIVNDTSPRMFSLSFLQEPYLMALCRKNDVAFIREESIDYMRDLIQILASRFIAAIPEVTSAPSAVLDEKVAAAVCEHLGLPIAGAAILPYFTEVDDMECLRDRLKNSADAVFSVVWALVGAEMLASARKQQELAFSLVLMRRLVETDRANVADLTVASTAGFICHKLDLNTFRYMMSFLLTKDEASAKTGKELFDDDIDDSWNESFPSIGEQSRAAADCIHDIW
jgi:hypothetical protein